MFMVLKHVRRFRGLSFTIYRRRNLTREEARLVKRIIQLYLSDDSNEAEEILMIDIWMEKMIEMWMKKILCSRWGERSWNKSERWGDTREHNVETMEEDIFQSVHIEDCIDEDDIGDEIPFENVENYSDGAGNCYSKNEYHLAYSLEDNDYNSKKWGWMLIGGSI